MGSTGYRKMHQTTPDMDIGLGKEDVIALQQFLNDGLPEGAKLGEDGGYTLKRDQARHIRHSQTGKALLSHFEKGGIKPHAGPIPHGYKWTNADMADGLRQMAGIELRQGRSVELSGEERAKLNAYLKEHTKPRAAQHHAWDHSLDIAQAGPGPTPKDDLMPVGSLPPKHSKIEVRDLPPLPAPTPTLPIPASFDRAHQHPGDILVQGDYFKPGGKPPVAAMKAQAAAAPDPTPAATPPQAAGQATMPERLAKALHTSVTRNKEGNFVMAVPEQIARQAATRDLYQGRVYNLMVGDHAAHDGVPGAPVPREGVKKLDNGGLEIQAGAISPAVMEHLEHPAISNQMGRFAGATLAPAEHVVAPNKGVAKVEAAAERRRTTVNVLDLPF